MYWTNWLDGTIRRANLDGSNVQLLFDSGAGAKPYGIALDLLHDRMYWTEASNGLIRRANFDGTDVEDILSVDVPVAITLDVMGNRMYWSQHPQDAPATIYKAHLDGSHIETIVTGLGAPYDLTITDEPSRVPEPGTALLLAVGVVTVLAADRRMQKTSHAVIGEASALAALSVKPGGIAQITITATRTNIDAISIVVFGAEKCQTITYLVREQGEGEASRLRRPGRMQVGHLPGVLLTDEYERSSLQW